MDDQQNTGVTTYQAPEERKPSRLGAWLREIQKPDERGHLLEILAAILLSLTTIASAWCAYQATRWSGVQAVYYSSASADRVESVRLSNQADQLTAIDVGLFTQYAAAVSQDNTRLATFLSDRFRPEFKVAYDAWLATSPLTNPNAPKSPFAMKEYVVAQAVQAEALQKHAENATLKANEANQTSDNYVLVVVMFALVLFFAGTGTKFKSMRIREVTLAFAAIVFLVGVAIVLAYPVS